MLITGVWLRSGARVDVLLRDGAIARVDATAAHAHGETTDGEVFDGEGHTLIPGLHNHHVHLAAAAAATRSVHVGPCQVSGAEQFAHVLTTAATDRDGWVRAVGYHETVAGELDRDVLDRIDADRPLRVQHRTGAMWFMNSEGLRREGRPSHPSGRVFRSDRTATTRFGGVDGLHAVSDRLAGYGVTGVTEATPELTDSDLRLLDDAVARGEIRQRVHVLSDPGDGTYKHLSFGPIKRIIDDDVDLAEFETWVAQQHRRGRPVAVHCVTVFQLVITVTVLRSVGTLAGDRVEHAAVVPDELVPVLAELGVTVVTQPNFVAERGDEYLADIPADEIGDLWRLGSLRDAGVRVACSTDAPFGGLDPWACMRAARDRRAPSSRPVNPTESVDGATALSMFLGAPDSPETPREVEVGARADLVLVAASPEDLHRRLDSGLVGYTIIGGEISQPSA